jgi:hypothetical protein
MTTDSVLAEVRRIREEYARQFQGNVQAMMDDLRRRNAGSNRVTVTRSPKLRSRVKSGTANS